MVIFLQFCLMRKRGTICLFPMDLFFESSSTYLLSAVKAKREGSLNQMITISFYQGDVVAPTMDTLMSVSYRDHNDNKRVYPTDVKNSKHEMPIHIVAMNKKCAQHIV